jgi:hypothetical protein
MYHDGWTYKRIYSSGELDGKRPFFWSRHIRILCEGCLQEPFRDVGFQPNTNVVFWADGPSFLNSVSDLGANRALGFAR